MFLLQKLSRTKRGLSITQALRGSMCANEKIEGGADAFRDAVRSADLIYPIIVILRCVW